MTICQEDPGRRCLKVDEWPPADQAAWATAIRPGHVLDDLGAASHWSPATLHKNRRGYGRWLTFLHGRNGIAPDQQPEDRVTKESVRRYLALLEEQDLAPYTVVARIDELRAVISAMAPDGDRGWLNDLVTRLKRRALPTVNKRPRLKPSADLFRWGLGHMDAAEAATGRHANLFAVRYRDGLMVALLAARPLRLSNLASIRIGHHLVRNGDTWLLVFEAHEIKNRRPFETPVPEELVPYLERYLDLWRPLLIQGRQTDRLWTTRRGRPMGSKAAYDRITKVTKRAFGTPLNPHLFRDCFATTIAIEDPEHVRISASILGHASLATTEKYYNQARTLEAGRLYQNSIVTMRREMRKLAQERE